MIDFYTADTPNGRKVHIMLEELGIPYSKRMLDLKSNEQKRPEFTKINPNGRIPAIVDLESESGLEVPVFESGAILLYLAEKSHHFLGSNEIERAQVYGWLMFQMSGIGPAFGNYYYAKNNNIPAMGERFEKESARLLSVMEQRLSESSFLAGDFYSIADIAMYPWIAAFLGSKSDWFESTPNVRKWAAAIAERPAVQKVMGTAKP
jgi:GST-like protein